MPVPALIPARDRVLGQLGGGLQALAVAACTRLLSWHELARQRRALLALDERMLKDIGISRAEAAREARRPFWRDGIDPRGDRTLLPACCARADFLPQSPDADSLGTARR